MEDSKWLKKYKEWKQKTLMGYLLGESLEVAIPLTTFCVGCITVITVVATTLKVAKFLLFDCCSIESW